MIPVAILPVKYFTAILYRNASKLTDCYADLQANFSPIDLESRIFPFEDTDYYSVEMGSPLKRIIVSLERLENPGRLAEFKLRTNTIELQHAVEGKRTVNIDIGYLDYYKVVLASAKVNWQKIYLSNGIYADPTLYYRKGRFHPFEWSFPDFKKRIYDDFFLKLRRLYKAQVV